MTTLLKLSRYLIFTMAFIATASYASTKVTLDFQNCTNKKVKASWNAYNFSFKGEIAKDDSAHGSFSLRPGNTTKTLWVYIDTIPEGHVKVHLSGGVSADFRVDQTMNPLGRIKYVTTSDKVQFDHTYNNAIRVFAKNTVKIGC